MAGRPKSLWAPWRIDYLETLGDDAPDPQAPPLLERGNGCFLCDAARDDLTPDEAAERLVLRRDRRGVLLLNRYPYANGHLLVAPLAHVADLAGLDDEALAGLMRLAQLGERALRLACHAQGMNLGMNLGKSAGAAVPGHAHLHLVPRWHGDVNFMQTIGGVRVIPQALDRSYENLRRAVEQIEPPAS